MTYGEKAAWGKKGWKPLFSQRVRLNHQRTSAPLKSLTFWCYTN